MQPFLASVFFLFSISVYAMTPFEQSCQRLAQTPAGGTPTGGIPAKSNSTARLHELFKLHWNYQMTEYPESATYAGFPGQNHRWTDLSLEAIERRKKELQAPYQVLLSIHRSQLKDADQLNYDLFKRNLETAIEGQKYLSEYLPLNQLDGVHINVPQLLVIMPHQTQAHYQDIIARLEALPVLIEQNLTLLKKGLEKGITPPQITLRNVPEQVKALTVKTENNPLLESFKDKADFKQKALQVLNEKIIPAYEKLHRFLTETYIPNARKTTAWSDLPDGKNWYAYQVKTTTTTLLTPQEIHAIGLKEVSRIRNEMNQVITSVGHKKGFEDFTKYLRTHSDFYYKDANELIREYRNIAKKLDPALTKLFNKLPRLPYGVIPLPSYSDQSAPTAYYEPGSPTVGRPGYFFANTYDLKSRPKWEMEALTLHEAVPGHHLQIAIAQEMTNVPEFRKHGMYTAFVEGWGLYAESLGKELGLYQDPYAYFGRLVYEMWRAIRLVVDTGMHSLGWSRSQTIEYFKTNTGKSEHDIVVEVDRYLVWGGQALAYKIGELSIQQLRSQATQQLGSQFDIRYFHDAVLENGALPIEILKSRIQRWVQHIKIKKEKNMPSSLSRTQDTPKKAAVKKDSSVL